jgi:hypothetical protein
MIAVLCNHDLRVTNGHVPARDLLVADGGVPTTPSKFIMYAPARPSGSFGIATEATMCAQCRIVARWLVCDGCGISDCSSGRSGVVERKAGGL